MHVGRHTPHIPNLGRGTGLGEAGVLAGGLHAGVADLGRVAWDRPQCDYNRYSCISRCNTRTGFYLKQCFLVLRVWT